MTAEKRLSDEQWQQIAPLLPSASGHHGRPYCDDHRRTVEGILWIAYSGAQWRLLPKEFGKWQTVYRRFRRWAERGVFSQVLAANADDLDLSISQVDGTFIKVHQDAAGARKSEGPPLSPDEFRPSGPQRGAILPSSSR